MRETNQGFAIAFQEGGAFEQVLGQITTDAKFGKDGQIGAAAGGFMGHIEDAGRVAGEIADGGVELAKGDFHG